MEIFIPSLQNIGLISYQDGDLHLDCKCNYTISHAPAWNTSRICNRKKFALKYIYDILQSTEKDSFVKRTNMSKVHFYKYLIDNDIIKFVSWLSQSCFKKSLPLNEFLSKKEFDEEDINADFTAALCALKEQFWLLFFRYKDVRTLVKDPFYANIARKAEKDALSSITSTFYNRYTYFESSLYPFLLGAVNPNLVKDVVQSLITDNKTCYSNHGKTCYISSFIFFNNDYVDNLIKENSFKSANFDIRCLFYENIIRWGKITENFISVFQKESSKNLSKGCSNVLDIAFPYITFDESIFISITRSKPNSFVKTAAKFAPLSAIPFFMRFRDQEILNVIQKRLESFDKQNEGV